MPMPQESLAISLYPLESLKCWVRSLTLLERLWTGTLLKAREEEGMQSLASLPADALSRVRDLGQRQQKNTQENCRGLNCKKTAVTV